MKRWLATSFTLLCVGILCLVLNAQAQMLPLLGAGGKFTSTVIAAGSGWGDHGTRLDLSTTIIANDTVTSNSNAGFSSARGFNSHITGKYYSEVKLLTAPPSSIFNIGLMDATTANGAPLDDNAIVNSCGTNGNDGTGRTDGSGVIATNIGSGLTTAANDILGIAFDGDNGFHYLAQNNVWFLSGDPTSGATGTGNICAYATSRNYYPWVAIWGLVNGVMQLKTASFTYTPPVGYSAWNYLLKRDVMPEAVNDNSPMWLAKVA